LGGDEISLISSRTDELVLIPIANTLIPAAMAAEAAVCVAAGEEDTPSVMINAIF
jgi:hypothetical protein